MSSSGSWYYAKGNDRYGPVSSSQLKTLVAEGKLDPADLVWKEGMDEWKPASKISGLFPRSTPESQAPDIPTASHHAQPEFTGVFGESSRASTYNRRPREGGLDVMQWGKPIGPPLLLMGIVLAVLAKGCDSVGLRGVSRLNAQHQKVLRDLRDVEDSDEREQLQENEDLLRKKVENAGTSFRTFSYYREWAFVAGTILLVIGLVGTGFTAEGAARWICLIMLAIITFSIYVGGTAWLGSMVSLIPETLF